MHIQTICIDKGTS